MKYLFLVGLGLVLPNVAIAQQAMDFNMTDCNGNMHHLYPDYLDNNEVVIMEYFMSCSSCIQVGQEITPIFNQLQIDYPGMVNFFAFGFIDNMDCSQALSFVNDNAINAVPFDSGETQLNYYYSGPFGMPNVVIVAGSQHQVLFNSGHGISANDTAAMDSIIRNFFTTMGNHEQQLPSTFEVYPNPAAQFITVAVGDIGVGSGIIINNISGQKILSKKITSQNETINVESWVGGIYFINIVGENINETKKIIIN